MNCSTALLRVTRESLSALLIALMLVSSVAQARQVAAHGFTGEAKTVFALCERMANADQGSDDSVPSSDQRMSCMECCLTLPPVLPGQAAIGVFWEWYAAKIAASVPSVAPTPLLIEQEARGPPVM